MHITPILEGDSEREGERDREEWHIRALPVGLKMVHSQWYYGRSSTVRKKGLVVSANENGAVRWGIF